MRKVYCAGPDVFHPKASARAEFQRATCAKHNLQALHPLDNQVEWHFPDGRCRPGIEVAREIMWANTALMKEADVIAANLTPFRGPSADAGTAFEIGYMDALNKPVYGYTVLSLISDTPYAARVFDRRPQGDLIVDDKGMLVEDFGLVDNLMIAVPLVHLAVECDGPGAWERAFDLCIAAIQNNASAHAH